ncbi:hypothetical protein AAT19DRAFT_14735 [Rhodotorula toruloides]|uniref:Uncharacterized protein n=1 Tax=Rhodotorula toruloides TaxID=5286 RepID=A0A2T0A8N4_RHOTO|nr:hypothetical protein AAT19DRAFT_14735 [Rhodotorula toruloides]
MGRGVEAGVWQGQGEAGRSSQVAQRSPPLDTLQHDSPVPPSFLRPTLWLSPTRGEEAATAQGQGDGSRQAGARRCQVAGHGKCGTGIGIFRARERAGGG